MRRASSIGLLMAISFDKNALQGAVDAAQALLDSQSTTAQTPDSTTPAPSETSQTTPEDVVDSGTSGTSGTGSTATYTTQGALSTPGSTATSSSSGLSSFQLLSGILGGTGGSGGTAGTGLSALPTSQEIIDALNAQDGVTATLNPDGTFTITADSLNLQVGGLSATSDNPVIIKTVTNAAGETQLLIEGNDVNLATPGGSVASQGESSISVNTDANGELRGLSIASQGLVTTGADGVQDTMVNPLVNMAFAADGTFEMTGSADSFARGDGSLTIEKPENLHLITRPDGSWSLGAQATSLSSTNGDYTLTGSGDEAHPFGFSMGEDASGVFGAQATIGTLALTGKNANVELQDGASLTVQEDAGDGSFLVTAGAGSAAAKDSNGNSVVIEDNAVLTAVLDADGNIKNVGAQSGTAMMRGVWGSALLDEGCVFSATQENDTTTVQASMGRATINIRGAGVMVLEDGEGTYTDGPAGREIAMQGQSASYQVGGQGTLTATGGAQVNVFIPAEGQPGQETWTVSGGEVIIDINQGPHLVAQNGTVTTVETDHGPQTTVAAESGVLTAEGMPASIAFTDDLVITHKDGWNSSEVGVQSGSATVNFDSGGSLALNGNQADIRVVGDTTIADVSGDDAVYTGTDGGVATGTGLRIYAVNRGDYGNTQISLDEGNYTNGPVNMDVVSFTANSTQFEDGRSQTQLGMESGVIHSVDSAGQTQDLTLGTSTGFHRQEADGSTALSLSTYAEGNMVLGAGGKETQVVFDAMPETLPSGEPADPIVITYQDDVTTGQRQGYFNIPTSASLSQTGSTFRIEDGEGAFVENEDMKAATLSFANGRFEAAGPAVGFEGVVVEGIQTDSQTQGQIAIASLVLETYAGLVGANQGLELVGINAVGAQNTNEDGSTSTQMVGSIDEILGGSDEIEVTGKNPVTGQTFVFNVLMEEGPEANGQKTMSLLGHFEVKEDAKIVLSGGGTHGEALWDATFGAQTADIVQFEDPENNTSYVHLNWQDVNVQAKNSDGMLVSVEGEKVEFTQHNDVVVVNEIEEAVITAVTEDGDSLTVDVSAVREQFVQLTELDTQGSVLTFTPTQDAENPSVDISLTFNVGGVPFSLSAEEMRSLQILATLEGDQAIFRAGAVEGEEGGQVSATISAIRMRGKEVGMVVDRRRTSTNIMFSDQGHGVFALHRTEGQRVASGFLIDVPGGKMHFGYQGNKEDTVHGHLLATVSMPYGAVDGDTYAMYGDKSLGTADLAFAFKGGLGVTTKKARHELGASVSLTQDSSIRGRFLGDSTTLVIDGKEFSLGDGVNLPTFGAATVGYGYHGEKVSHEVVLGAGADALALHQDEQGPLAFFRHQRNEKLADGSMTTTLGLVSDGDKSLGVQMGYRRTFVEQRQGRGALTVSAPDKALIERMSQRAAQANGNGIHPQEVLGQIATAMVATAEKATLLARKSGMSSKAKEQFAALLTDIKSRPVEEQRGFWNALGSTGGLESVFARLSGEDQEAVARWLLSAETKPMVMGALSRGILNHGTDKSVQLLNSYIAQGGAKGSEGRALAAVEILSIHEARRRSMDEDEEPLDLSLVSQARSTLATELRAGIAAKDLSAIGTLVGLGHAPFVVELLEKRSMPTLGAMARQDAEAFLAGQSDGAVWGALATCMVDEGRRDALGFFKGVLEGSPELGQAQDTFTDTDKGLLLSGLSLEAVEKISKWVRSDSASRHWAGLFTGDDIGAAVAGAKSVRQRQLTLAGHGGIDGPSAKRFALAEALRTIKYDHDTGVEVHLSGDAYSHLAKPENLDHALVAANALKERLAVLRAEGQEVPANILWSPLDDANAPLVAFDADTFRPTLEQTLDAVPMLKAQLASQDLHLQGLPSQQALAADENLRQGVFGFVDFMLERPEMLAAHGIDGVTFGGGMGTESYRLGVLAKDDATYATTLEVSNRVLARGYGMSEVEKQAEIRRAEEDARFDHEVDIPKFKESGQVWKLIWEQQIKSLSVDLGAGSGSFAGANASLTYQSGDARMSLTEGVEGSSSLSLSTSHSEKLSNKTTLAASMGVSVGANDDNPTANIIPTASATLNHEIYRNKHGGMGAYVAVGMNPLGALGANAGFRTYHDFALVDIQSNLSVGGGSIEATLGPDESPVGLVFRGDTFLGGSAGLKVGEAKVALTPAALGVPGAVGLAIRYGDGPTFMLRLMPPFIMIEPAAPQYRQHGYLGPLTRLGTSNTGDANEMALTGVFYGVLAKQRGLKVESQEMEAWVEKFALGEERQALLAMIETARTPAAKVSAEAAYRAWHEDLIATIMIDSYLDGASATGDAHKPNLDPKDLDKRFEKLMAGTENSAEELAILRQRFEYQELRAKNLEAFAPDFFEAHHEELQAAILWARTEMLLQKKVDYPQWRGVLENMAPLEREEFSKAEMASHLRSNHEALRASQKPVRALSDVVKRLGVRRPDGGPGQEAWARLQQAVGQLEQDSRALVDGAAGLNKGLAGNNLKGLEKDRQALLKDARQTFEGLTLGDSEIDQALAELLAAGRQDLAAPVIEALRELKQSPEILVLLPQHPKLLEEAFSPET